MTSHDVIDVVTSAITVSLADRDIHRPPAVSFDRNSSTAGALLFAADNDTTRTRLHAAGNGGGLSRRSQLQSRPFLLDDGWTTVAVNGWAHPPIAALTLFTNFLVCVVLLRREMRTPTNVLLVAMAVSDTLTAVLPTPCFVRFYTLGMYSEWVPYRWCFAYLLLTDYLPTVMHTASIWLTLALATQRYLCVCRVGQSTAGSRRPRVSSAAAAGKWFSTVRSTVGLVGAIFAASFLAHGFRFGEYKYQSVSVLSRQSTTPSPAVIVTPAAGSAAPRVWRPSFVSGCRYDIAPFLANHTDALFATYYCTRIVIVHLIPSVALVALNTALIWTMRVAARRRKQLMNQQRVSIVVGCANAESDCGNAGELINGGVTEKRCRRECRRLTDSNATTMMLVAVVGLLLAVELPLAVLLIVTIVENTFRVAIMSQRSTTLATIIINFIIILSYPLNFFIYCAMSRKFRETFLRLFGRRCRPNGANGGFDRGATSRRDSTEAETRGATLRRPSNGATFLAICESATMSPSRVLASSVPPLQVTTDASLSCAAATIAAATAADQLKPTLVRLVDVAGNMV